MKPINRLLIVEDYKLFREGLCSMLKSQDFIEIAGDAENGIQAIKKTRQLKPDMVLLDLSMPQLTGSSAIREIKREFPNVKILVLTVHKDDQYVADTFQAGADGYCLKDASPKELVVAAKCVLDGNLYISPAITESVKIACLYF